MSEVPVFCGDPRCVGGAEGSRDIFAARVFVPVEAVRALLRRADLSCPNGQPDGCECFGCAAVRLMGGLVDGAPAVPVEASAGASEPPVLDDAPDMSPDCGDDGVHQPWCRHAGKPCATDATRARPAVPSQDAREAAWTQDDERDLMARISKLYQEAKLTGLVHVGARGTVIGLMHDAARFAIDRLGSQRLPATSQDTEEVAEAFLRWFDGIALRSTHLAALLTAHAEQAARAERARCMAHWRIGWEEASSAGWDEVASAIESGAPAPVLPLTEPPPAARPVCANCGAEKGSASAACAACGCDHKPLNPPPAGTGKENG